MRGTHVAMAAFAIMVAGCGMQPTEDEPLPITFFPDCIVAWRLKPNECRVITCKQTDRANYQLKCGVNGVYTAAPPDGHIHCRLGARIISGVNSVVDTIREPWQEPPGSICSMNFLITLESKDFDRY